jgi:hypothetical protein
MKITVKGKREYSAYQVRDENDVDEFVSDHGFDGAEIKGWKIKIIGENNFKLVLEFGDYIVYDDVMDGFSILKPEEFSEIYEICSTNDADSN